MNARQTDGKPLLKSRVFIVDDHEIVRIGIGSVINRQEDLQLCGEAETAAEALLGIPLAKPNLVLVDLGLQGTSGMDLIRNLRVQYPSLLMAVLSNRSESIYGELALRAGAAGYLMKSEKMETILMAIRRILRGVIYVSDALTARLIEEQVRGRDSAAAPLGHNLTEREIEVFSLIGQCKGTKEIGKILNLSIKTVEYYQGRIKRKLHLKNSSELIQCAMAWLQ